MIWAVVRECTFGPVKAAVAEVIDMDGTFGHSAWAVIRWLDLSVDSVRRI